MYIQCRSQFNLGTEYFAEANYYGFTAMGLAFPTHLGTCHSPAGIIYIPVVNLQTHPVKIGPNDPLIWAYAISGHTPGKESVYDIQICESEAPANCDPGPGQRVWDPGERNSQTSGPAPGAAGRIWDPGEYLYNEIMSNMGQQDETPSLSAR